MNIEKYTQNAQGAIIDCQNIAVEEGHQQIDGEHLHMALLMQKDGLIKTKKRHFSLLLPFSSSDSVSRKDVRV